jgi:hypothetical protein
MSGATLLGWHDHAPICLFAAHYGGGPVSVTAATASAGSHVRRPPVSRITGLTNRTPADRKVRRMSADWCYSGNEPDGESAGDISPASTFSARPRRSAEFSHTICEARQEAARTHAAQPRPALCTGFGGRL